MKRSTKTTSPRAAERLAFKYEEAARKKLTKKTARRIIGDIYEIASGEKLPGESTRKFFELWVAQSKTRVKGGTWRKYNDEAKRFLASLGEKAERDISTVNRADILAFQTGVASRLSVGTANLALKIIRIALGEANKQGLIDFNPATNVGVLSDKNVEPVRRPFTLPEIKKLLKIADKEWIGMILFGFYTGQRLQDIATTTWKAVDLKTQRWTLTTIKTHQNKILPLAVPLLKYLRSLKSAHGPKTHVFPILAASVKKTGRVAQVSNAFHDLLVETKMLPPRSKQKTGKGRSERRKLNELSFHCLRHTNNSLLKKAGVPESVVMAFVGHDSPEISKQYTHVEEESLVRAVKALPDISK